MNRLRFWTLVPARALNFLFFLVPMGIVVLYSLMTRGPYGGQAPPFNLDNYVRLADPLYLTILLRSFWIAGISTFFAMLLGFPLALFIANSGKSRSMYLNLVMLPFWTSFLVRTYAWMFLLRDTGLINSGLMALGVIREPLPMLYNDAAVVLGLVYGYLPFMVLPIYSTLEKLDPSLLEAAADLGATPWVSLWRVTVPLALPGIVAGSILVFIPCLGAYLTPDLLGGGKSVMIGNVVQNQFTTARDWPFGASLSLVLTGLVMVLLWLFVRKGGDKYL
ncbi:MAG: ABC transporter permease [Acidobacteria bacterium]|nr:ABC transporter permease [Acidobacteriota bacterium]